MNTTASYSSDHSSWLNTSSRRNSIESVLSIQGKETDYVRDTTDTEWVSDDHDLEYEPATEAEDEAPVDGDTSEDTDDQIISTKVIEVSVNDDGDLEFADSEQTDTDDTDSEMDLHDYWECAQCHNENNNPLYRYCQRCFKVRKNFFPPRPKRKQKCTVTKEAPTVHRLVDRDSGVDSVYNSQELSQVLSGDSEVNTSQNSQVHVSDRERTVSGRDVNVSGRDVNVSGRDVNDSGRDVNVSGRDVNDSGGDVNVSGREGKDRKREVSDNKQEDKKLDDLKVDVDVDVNKTENINNVILETRSNLKRRAESADRNRKRNKIEYTDSDSCSDSDNKRKSKSVGPEVASLSKMNSDPSLTIENTNDNDKQADPGSDNMCIMCFNEPKSGVFVHGRIAHICCCYKCAVKVWAKSKRCPVCNCKVSNVLKAVVM